jgi:MFS family permease
MENAEGPTTLGIVRDSRPNRFIQSTGALSQPMFRRYWLGTVATAGSLQVLQIGVGWLVVTDLDGGAGVLGIIGGAIAIPSILVTLFGGVLADRINLRVVLIATSAANGLLMTLLALLVVTGTIEVWHIVLIAAGQGILGGFELPVRAAFFPQLLDREQLPSAVSHHGIAFHLSRLVTPTVGGLAIRYLGTESVFFAGAGGWVAHHVHAAYGSGWRTGTPQYLV